VVDQEDRHADRFKALQRASHSHAVGGQADLAGARRTAQRSLVIDNAFTAPSGRPTAKGAVFEGMFRPRKAPTRSARLRFLRCTHPLVIRFSTRAACRRARHHLRPTYRGMRSSSVSRMAVRPNHLHSANGFPGGDREISGLAAGGRRNGPTSHDAGRILVAPAHSAFVTTPRPWRSAMARSPSSASMRSSSPMRKARAVRRYRVVPRAPAYVMTRSREACSMRWRQSQGIVEKHRQVPLLVQLPPPMIDHGSTKVCGQPATVGARRNRVSRLGHKKVEKELLFLRQRNSGLTARTTDHQNAPEPTGNRSARTNRSPDKRRMVSIAREPIFLVGSAREMFIPELQVNNGASAPAWRPRR